MSGVSGPVQIGDGNVMYVGGHYSQHHPGSSSTSAAVASQGRRHTAPAANKPKKVINGKSCCELCLRYCYPAIGSVRYCWDAWR